MRTMVIVLLSLMSVSISGLNIGLRNSQGLTAAQVDHHKTQATWNDKKQFVAVKENGLNHVLLTGSNFIGDSKVTYILDDGDVPLGVWLTDAVGFVMMAIFGSYLAIANDESGIKGTCSVMIYVILSTLIDINIAAAGNGGGFDFEPACAVAFIEFIKLSASIILYTISRWPVVTKGEPYIQKEFSIIDALYLGVPGLLFAFNNILLYLSLGNNELASFGVFRDTNVIFSAMIWCFVFKASLGLKRSLAVTTVFLGLCLNQVMPLLNASWTPAIGLVCMMALTNSIASVGNELAIKQNLSLDINLQNTVLYGFCIISATAYIAVTHPAKLSSLSTFFEGFHLGAAFIIGLQVSVGLMVSRILKYADAVTKTVAAALRGPILVFLAPLAGLYSRLDPVTISSAVVVAVGAGYFLIQGRPEAGTAVAQK